MSADLLRRAAAKLREHAEAATPGPWATGPSEELPGWAGVWDLHRITVTGKPGTDEVGKPWAPEVARVEYNANGFQFPHHEARNDAAFIALLHPPVALALATLFDRSADAMREIEFLANTHRVTEPHLAHLSDLMEVVRVARTLLREEES